MRRKTVFAIVLLGLLAGLSGCSANGSLSMNPVNDTELAEEASHPAPTDTSADGDDALIRNAIENGTATVADDDPPVDQQLPFRHDGRFYALEYTENGTEPGYDVEIRIDLNASSVDGTVVDYEELPAVDRATLESSLSFNHSDAILEPGYDIGAGATYTEADVESSVLVRIQEYDAVRYEGKVYPIDANTEQETLTVYRYEAREVAESHGAYAASLRERYEFELTNLSQDERDIVDESIDDTYWVEDGDNEAFDSLVDRFRDHEAVEETDHDGSYVVRYDGDLYWTEVDYGSYAGEE
ncbi:hypothetical protein [Halosimplex sp. J119]